LKGKQEKARTDLVEAEAMATTKLARVVRRNGYIATLRKARTGKKCNTCGYPIEPGSWYYSVVLGGGGLGWLKFPDYVHTNCLDDYPSRR